MSAVTPQKSAPTYRIKRYFTPQEATAMVPFLERRFARIEEVKREIGKHVETLQEAGIDATDMDLEPEQLEPEQARQLLQMREAVAEINTEIEAIQELGIVVKDLDAGLVDFFARLDGDGRDVFLCWHSGEERVSWWHPIESGFAGRQQIDDQRFSSFAWN